MLLVCMAWYYAEGSDPFAIVTGAAEVHGHGNKSGLRWNMSTHALE